ncbi:PrsW family intramembrane metalloprotease [uncultured Jatrophihabitans sp.]|uniref:PrsW family intramembrane metalloprotease n=1 Tax=uncultured Jatrophihabitans sp. TaxID=1610747 RepID=UPI0035CA871D
MSSAAPAVDARRERDKALTHSGWGMPFRLTQPRNLCWYVLLLGWVGGVGVALSFIQPTAAVYSTALTIGIVGCALYGIPWWLYLNHLNRLAIVPHRAALTAFVWGFAAATFWIAIRANDALLSIYGKLFGQSFVRNYGPGLAAPFTEETAKMLGLILLIGLAPHIVRTPFDGFILGAFIGLGFQISEDILYAFQSGSAQFGTNQVGQALHIIVLRAGSGFFSHAMYSAIYCAGLIWLLDRDGSHHRLRGVSLMVLAMVFHGTWDLGGSYLYPVMPAAAALFINYAVSIALSLLTVRWVLVSVEREASGWIEAVLRPEIDNGTLSPTEVDGIAAWRRKDRKAYRKTFHGHRAKHAGKHLVAAGEELAAALAHDGDEDTSRVRFARAEIARIRGG